ncbi:MAG TPA: choice-of-anchor Q domain-containing protein [Candidatus Baltobacteraceae bacterium]|jgi:hypothetical protein
MLGRTIALLLAGALIAGCSGTSRILPGTAPGVSAPQFAIAPDRGEMRVFVSVRIPRRSRGRHDVHPATISPLTQSLSIAVNTSKAQIFNTTPASPGCTAGTGGTTCTFAAHAKAGTDTFTVTTYSGVNATGTPLDRGIVAKVPIAKGKANHVAVRLGPLVTTTANTGTGSLRYAVATASAGDTVMFSLPAGSTITLATPITISGTVTIAGPGATGLTISGGAAHQLFSIAGTATISGLTLTHGKAAAGTPGGAIYNAGSLTLAGDVIGGSTSTVAIRRVRSPKPTLRIVANGLHPHCTATTADGGAVYNNGTLVISGTIFSNNVIHSVAGCVTAQGGAIFNDALGTLTSTNDQYNGNSAQSGGAVYNAAIGEASFTNDSFTANTGCNASSGCPTTGCGTTTCTSSAFGEGIAIYDHGTGITVVNSTFTNNVAGGPVPGSVGEGGAIALDTNSILATITGSTFTGNRAGGGTSSCSTGAGGAIVAVNPIELDNDTFKNNSATGDETGEGGAVFAEMGVTGSNDIFTGNKAVGSGGHCTANGDGYGGAVFSLGNVTFNGSTFSTNAGSANFEGAGGAIAGAMDITIDKGTFTSNTATSTGINGATSNEAAGGALYATDVVKVTSSTFTSNAISLAGTSPSSAIGGAIVAGTALVSTGSTYTSNSIKQTSGTAGTAAGGAVGTLSGTWISDGEKFTSNSVTAPGTAGGGAGIVSTGTCIISNDTVTSNLVRGGASLGGVGGGIAVGSACNITHVVISGNTATPSGAVGFGAGGGLYDTGGSTILNSTITGNTAKTEGGGIIEMTNTETITNSVISGNTVTSASAANAGGGGIYSAGGVNLNDVTIANNTVTISGPGPAGGGGIFDAAGIGDVYTTISGNKVLGTAPNSGGGGIYTNAGIISLDNTIGNNSSSENGGGVDVAGSAVTFFENATIYANAATHAGGNALVGASATIELVNSILAGGTAPTGKDAANAGTFTSNGDNIVGSAVTGYTPAAGDLADTDPKLLPLTNNGGPTFTFADQAAGVSPGTQHIAFSSSKCGTISTTVDQRGFTRGAGGKCDVGAYEHAGVATAIGRRPPLHVKVKPHVRGAIAASALFANLKPMKLKGIPL